jgi:putative oxidoreductase
VTVAAVFIAHGLPKLIPLWGGSPAATTALFASLGLPSAALLVTSTGVLEILGGVTLIAGIWTRWVTVLLVVHQVVEIGTLRWPHGFFLNWSLEPGVGHGVEFGVLVVAALVCLMLSGPGDWSIDGQRNRDAEARALGRQRLRSRL